MGLFVAGLRAKAELGVGEIGKSGCHQEASAIDAEPGGGSRLDRSEVAWLGPVEFAEP